jgi:5,10-methylenetetrahydromethanopterin reductase
MQLSCAFAPTPHTPDHIALAERLGYHRAWCYDSPALYPDVWVTLALAATRTERIGLGPGVLVPNLRHVMTNAAAIATLVDLAPGRLAVAIGSGFTGARCLGQKPMRWRDVTEYVEALQGLLRGEDVAWEGTVIRMMQPDGVAPNRPIEVPILIAAAGPKGVAAAKNVGDGIFFGGAPSSAASEFSQVALLSFGTVLETGEAADSGRVMAAAGHAAAVALHAAYEWAPHSLDNLPGGPEWRAQIEQVPADTRHLAVHDLHLLGVTERDRPFITAERLSALAFTPEQLRERLDAFAAAGVTEIAYQPAGPEIERELTAFYEAATG